MDTWTRREIKALLPDPVAFEDGFQSLAGPRPPLVHAMGHKFGLNLLCVCGVGWKQQQNEPRQCEGVQEEGKA